ncbi:transposase [Escherichia coli]
MGVAAAARELSLYESQLYAWRSKLQQQMTPSATKRATALSSRLLPGQNSVTVHHA